MATLRVMRGLPGSGKSTWARATQAAFPQGAVAVLSRDDVREKVFGLSLAPGQGVLNAAGEDAVTAVTEVRARALLSRGVHVIADATHLSDEHLAPWVALALEVGADLELVDLRHIPVEECIARDAARAAAGGRGVGAKVIRELHETGRPTWAPR